MADKLICSTCKRDLEPVKDKIDSEYTSYQEETVCCIQCIEKDMSENWDEWNDFGHLWDSHFSDIEKMFYDMDGYTCSPEGTKAPEDSMNKTWIEVEKTSFFLSWRIMASMRAWGLPDKYMKEETEEDEEPSDAQRESLDKQYDNMVLISNNVMEQQEKGWKDKKLIKELNELVTARFKIMKNWSELQEKIQIQEEQQKPETTRGLPKELEHSNEIFSFVHCAKCIGENHSYPLLECGWTKFGFMVMCKNHNEQIAFFPLTPEMIPVGCECKKCLEDGR